MEELSLKEISKLNEKMSIEYLNIWFEINKYFLIFNEEESYEIKKVNYIAIDKDGSIFGYSDEPEVGIEEWFSVNKSIYDNMIYFGNIFQLTFEKDIRINEMRLKLKDFDKSLIEIK